jgi:hypothetical protein
VVGTDTQLNNFSFVVSSVQNYNFFFDAPPPQLSVNAIFELFQWDGSAIVGPTLYESSVTTLSNTTPQLVTWSPHINLVSGSSYIALLNSAGLNSPTSVYSGLEVTPGPVYSGGILTWEVTAGDGIWRNGDGQVSNQPGYDLGGTALFRAEFSPAGVPGPLAGSGLPGLILASCGLFGWLYRWRISPRRSG